MIEVPLSGPSGTGLVAIIDDEDFERVSSRRWYVRKHRSSLTIYARCRPHLYMHRLVMNAKPGQTIDHIDGNGLNNQKCNLRFATQKENVVSGIRRRKVEQAKRDFDEWESRL